MDWVDFILIILSINIFAGLYLMSKRLDRMQEELWEIKSIIKSKE